MRKLKIVKIRGHGAFSNIYKKAPNALKQLEKADSPLYTPKCNAVI